MRKTILLPALTIVAVLLLTGCSGDAREDTTGPTVTTAPTVAPEPTTEPTSEVPAEVPFTTLVSNAQYPATYAEARARLSLLRDRVETECAPDTEYLREFLAETYLADMAVLGAKEGAMDAMDFVALDYATLVKSACL